LLHWTAFIPWGLTRFIPTFVAVLAGRSAVSNIQDAIPASFVAGMTLVGGMLPATHGVELLSGLNLPMLELLVQRGRAGVDLKEIALSAGSTGVVDIGARLRKAVFSEEARDGHG
jgi:PTS system sorbose-specific iic component